MLPYKSDLEKQITEALERVRQVEKSGQRNTCHHQQLDRLTTEMERIKNESKPTRARKPIMEDQEYGE